MNNYRMTLYVSKRAREKARERKGERDRRKRERERMKEISKVTTYVRERKELE